MNINTGDFKYWVDGKPVDYIYNSNSGPDVDTGSFNYWINPPVPYIYSVANPSYNADLYLLIIGNKVYATDVILQTQIDLAAYGSDVFVTGFELKPNAPGGGRITSPNAPGGGAILAPSIPGGGKIQGPMPPHGSHVAGARNDN